MNKPLVRALERAQRLGFIGTGSLSDHIDHALGFAVVPPPGAALDLGSGGGLPGLVLAVHWPASRWVLLDANERRTAWLEQVVAELDLHDRVAVRCQRAEVAARTVSYRSRFDLVVARGFGPPSVTAECGAGFLQVGGRLVVSEPPDDIPDRWRVDGLAAFGLDDEGRMGAVRVLRQVQLAGAEVPRRVGVPQRRPRW